jgi:hypothetical protein
MDQKIGFLFGDKAEPTMVECDNESCIKLTKNSIFHDRSVKFGSIDSHSPMRGHMGHLRLAREIWRINQSCEVLTKARGNVQPL